MFAVQLARLAGARVIGTGSATSAGALRALGAEPVAYGDGLAGRVPWLPRASLRPSTCTGRRLRRRHGNLAFRTSASPPSPHRSAESRRNGANAASGAIEEIARLVAAGQLRVPIAASFPVGQVRAAVELQAGLHVHGKVVIDL